MSRAIVAHSFNVKDLTRLERCVLLAMADFAGKHGIVYACQEKIGAKVGYSIRSVRNAIKSLVEKGLLKFLKRGITKTYRIINLREHNNYPEPEQAAQYKDQRKTPPDKKISPKKEPAILAEEPAKTADKQVKTTSLSTPNKLPDKSGKATCGGNDRHAEANQSPPATLKNASPAPGSSAKEEKKAAPDSGVKKWKGPTRQAVSNESDGVVLADWKPKPGFDYYADLKAAVKGKSGVGLFRGLIDAFQPEPEPKPSEEALLAQAKKAFSGVEKKKKIVSKAAAKQLQEAGLWKDDEYEVLS